MSDEDSWKEFMKSNSKILCKSTVIGAELVLGLFEKGLIDEQEKDILSNPFTPNITRAMQLYTSIANKWNQNQYDDFKLALQETGNLFALQMLTNAEAEIFLTNEQIQLIRQQREKSSFGCYEGLEFDDEVSANKVVQNACGDKMFIDGKFLLSGDLDRREVIKLVRQFAQAQKNETIWFNPRKPLLSKYFISRHVARAQYFQPDSYDSSEEEDVYSWDLEKQTTPLIEEVLEKLVVLVDPPGMGKSSELTFLQQQLQKRFTRKRIILRINLNEVQIALSTISSNEAASSVILKLAPFLPPKILQTPGVRIFLLLDGLDEVCPKHEATMINLLRTLNASDDFSDLHVVVTTRPHLKNVLESDFKLKTWSLLPLKKFEQDNCMKEMGIPFDKLTEIRGTLTESMQDMLSNPLMLFMLVGVLKAGGSLSGSDVNIYDLYSRFVDVKHELHCVEKHRMEPGANFTEMATESMLRRNLQFYYHFALNELILEYLQLPSAFIDSLGGVVTKPPLKTSSRNDISGELLSYGLIVEDNLNNLVFKHRSFAEFFYAKLMLSGEESISQVVRDTLFGCIYRGWGAFENVETFLAAALSKRPVETPSIRLTTNWIISWETFYERRDLLKKFGEGNFFPHIAKEILMTFVVGDSSELWEAFLVLIDRSNKETLLKLVKFMTENKEWCRKELFKISDGFVTTAATKTISSAVLNLMVIVAVSDEGQLILSSDEVTEVFRSCDRLLYIVASIQTKKRKWEFVSSHFQEGGLKERLLKVVDEDFSSIIRDKETVWKLIENLSKEELFCLLTNEETRVTDIVGRSPRDVCITFGENFISGLAEFRVKFGDDKGKTVFELSEVGDEYALNFLWEDLLKEYDGNNLNGKVRLCLKESIWRSANGLIQSIHERLIRRNKCSCCPAPELINKNDKECDQFMDWIVGGQILLWDIHFLRFILQETSLLLSDKSLFMVPLNSLIKAASSQDDENSVCFSELVSFLQENLHKHTPHKTRFLTEVFLGATRQEIRNATLSNHCSCRTLYDVSVGQVFIKLVQNSAELTVNKHSWKLAASDVVEFTRCCDLPIVLQELKQKVESEKKLQKCLRSEEVLSTLTKRFSSQYRKKEEPCDFCGLSHLLSFYFSVFGFNLEWMTGVSDDEAIGVDWNFLKTLPVEIFTVLEKNFQWTSLVLQFEQMLRKSQAKYFDPVGGLLKSFQYRTEGEWERLIHLTGVAESLKPGLGSVQEIQSGKAAPFIRTLVSMFGVEEAKGEVSHLWNCIPSCISSSDDSPESLGSLLHLAIELGEEEEVEKRAWPGLLRWRNCEGKNALDIAKETFKDDHPIRVHLQTLTSSMRSIPLI